jgi:deoxyribodipyrimidine photo-lyase
MRDYVPEVTKVMNRHNHEPHLMTEHEQARAGFRIGTNYPSPIVDHRQARQEYLGLGKQQVTK